MYLCEVQQEKPGAKTFEDMDTVTSETEPSVPPDEGNFFHLHFYPHVISFFLKVGHTILIKLKTVLYKYNFLGIVRGPGCVGV